MTTTTQRKELSDRQLWNLLHGLFDEHVPFPIAISAERFSDYGPRLCVQIKQDDFRTYFERIDNPVMRTDCSADDVVHVHVTGRLGGQPVHVISVMPLSARAQR